MDNKYIMLNLCDDDVNMFAFSGGEIQINKITKTEYDECGYIRGISDSHYSIKAKKMKLADVELDELEYLIEELENFKHKLQTQIRGEN